MLLTNRMKKTEQKHESTTEAVLKCQSKFNKRNTIKKRMLQPRRIELINFYWWLLLLNRHNKKKCFFRLNKIIIFSFHFVISLKAFVDDDCGTWSECTKRSRKKRKNLSSEMLVDSCCAFLIFSYIVPFFCCNMKFILIIPFINVFAFWYAASLL